MNVASNYGPPMQVRFEWIDEAFTIYRRDAGVWILSTLIVCLFSATVALSTNGHAYFSLYYSFVRHTTITSESPFGTGLGFFGSILNLIVQSFFGAGLYRMANLAARGERLTLTDLFLGGRSTWNFILYHIIFVIMSFFGYLMCFFGIFFVDALIYPGFAIVADGKGAGAAISQSFDKMKWDWAKAGLFYFVYSMIVVLSALPCFLGLFVTVPMGIIISALAYRDMGVPDQMVYSSIPGQSWPPSPTSWPPPPVAEQPYQPEIKPTEDGEGFGGAS